MVPQVCTITWIFFQDIFAKFDRPDTSYVVSNFIFLNFGIEIGFFEIPLLNTCWSSKNTIFSYFGYYQILVGMFNFKFEHTVEQVFVYTFELKNNIVTIRHLYCCNCLSSSSKLLFSQKIPLGMSNHAVLARKFFLEKMIGNANKIFWDNTFS